MESNTVPKELASQQYSVPCFGLLLAAGSSRRFGADKRLQPMPCDANSQTEPLALGLCTIKRWLAACGGADGFRRVFVVTRPEDEFAHLVRRFLLDHPLLAGTLISADAAHKGMGHTLAQAAQQITPGRLVVGLADMPWVQTTTLRVITERLANASPRAIVRPRFDGQYGNPLGFGQDNRTALLTSEGDEGAREHVRKAHRAGQLIALDVDDPGILYDIDQPSDLDPQRCGQVGGCQTTQ